MLAVEGGPIVKPLVRLKPVEGREVLVAAVDVAAVRSVLGVDAHVNLEAVRVQEGFSAAFLSALERKLACIVEKINNVPIC